MTASGSGSAAVPVGEDATTSGPEGAERWGPKSHTSGCVDAMLEVACEVAVDRSDCWDSMGVSMGMALGPELPLSMADEVSCTTGAAKMCKDTLCVCGFVRVPGGRKPTSSGWWGAPEKTIWGSLVQVRPTRPVAQGT